MTKMRYEREAKVGLRGSKGTHWGKEGGGG